MKKETLIAIAILFALTGVPAALWTWETIRPNQSGKARSALQTLLLPFMRVGAWSGGGLKNGLEFLVTTGDVRRKNQLLELKIAQLSAENDALRAATTGYERLGGAAYIADLCEWRFVAANVLAYDPRRQASSLVLDCGTQDDIRPGDPVLHMRGVAGFVVRAGPWSSTVQLLNDPEAAVGAVIPAFNARGLVRGARGENEGLTITIQEREGVRARLEPGYKVVTSGIEGSLYPAGLTIGEVGESKTNEFGQSTYEVRPAVDFRRIEEALVLKIRKQTEPPGEESP